MTDLGVEKSREIEQKYFRKVIKNRADIAATQYSEKNNTHNQSQNKQLLIMAQHVNPL